MLQDLHVPLNVSLTIRKLYNCKVKAQIIMLLPLIIKGMNESIRFCFSVWWFDDVQQAFKQFKLHHEANFCLITNNLLYQFSL